MESDPGETTNLAARHPDVMRDMLALLRHERARRGIVPEEELRP